MADSAAFLIGTPMIPVMHSAVEKTMENNLKKKKKLKNHKKMERNDKNKEKKGQDRGPGVA